ncbi:TrmH family RNA methyltransferase [Jeotgalibacillus soli]|uniref:RNA 2-O ribose methyltransferase substrate binding domain-containing protein n=1 Tax=Jeotgalibacillus soli TaxID=889306 RepID=A0A0C2RPV3_9BACL|nr:RNA methyltransferase [Jeotgalibacillus soli]KIL43789.1 hypothetical protein KP78_36130 [Jeotgalibacillus soli]
MKFLQSTQNVQVKQWKKLSTKKGRDQSGLFLVEGFHLVEEALRTLFIVEEVIIQEGVDIPHSFQTDEVDITMVTREIVDIIAETEYSQGIFAVCKQENKEITTAGFERVLIIDSVQDPGNIGTMIRTADAVGMDAVVLGKGSADPYNAKVLRSAQGSHFHLPIIKAAIQEVLTELKERDIPVYGTALEGGKPFKDVPSGGSFALIMGNEGAGVQDEWLKQSDQNLYIPIYGKSESLNVAVATGVLLYHLKG